MSKLRGKFIELWVEERDGEAAVNPIMQGLLADLEAAGAAMAVRVPEHDVFDLEHVFETSPPDLVLLKSATSLALSLAIVAEAAGVRVLNDVSTTVNAHDKAATIARLAAAHLPVPTTFLAASSSSRHESVPSMDGRWVVKPVRGIHGQGVSTHSTMNAAAERLLDPSQVEGYVVDDGARLVQQAVGDEGEADIKVYVAGEMLFAGAKTFSATSYANNEIAKQQLDERTIAIVRAVGPALGLRCYGVDLRMDGNAPTIIDANPFPGYRGFPGAISALRAEIEWALEHQS